MLVVSPTRSRANSVFVKKSSYLKGEEVGLGPNGFSYGQVSKAAAGKECVKDIDRLLFKSDYDRYRDKTEEMSTKHRCSC